MSSESANDIRVTSQTSMRQHKHNETLSDDNNIDNMDLDEAPSPNDPSDSCDYVEEDDDSGSSRSSEDSRIDDLPEEMTSWRDTFFDITRRANDMIVNYRFPLLFALITAAGPRTVHFIDRVVWSDVFRKKAKAGIGHRAASYAGAAYAPPPAWMLHSLAAVPRSVESTISTVLNAFGIPTLSQLQLAQLNKELEALSQNAAEERQASPSQPPPAAEQGNAVTDGIPFSLLIPVASAVILLGAKLLVANHARRLPSHDVSEDEASTPIVEDSRSQLTEGADVGAPSALMAVENCVPQSEALELSPKPLVPKLDVQGRRPTDASQERNTSRSAASSEPTHGTRTKDPNRLTPRTSMLRSNSEAISGSIQRKRLVGSAQNSATRQRIPELNELSVDTPPRIHILETSQCSPTKTCMMPMVMLALTTPATQVEINAVVAAAQKYNVHTVIVCKERRDVSALTATSLNGSLIVEEVNDVVAHCQQVCADRRMVAVALVAGRPSDATSTSLHAFQYPISDGTLFCVDPQDVGNFGVLPTAGDLTAVPIAQPAHASHPLPTSLRWCHRCVHLDNESDAQRGIPGIVNVCLLDRSVKLRRALDEE